MNEPLWRWPELCSAIGLAPADGPDIDGVTIDSRATNPGDLFVALPGDPGPRFNASSRSERDGHDFVPHAASNGATAALVHRSVESDLPLLQARDTLDGLWDIGRARRAALTGDIVAVTGSSGKTTAKAFLAAALDAFTTGGSLNNHLGVPLSLARTPVDTATAVYEIGTNHPGEIAPLSELVRPTVAVVLNVHPAHAEFFADANELRKEKLSIHKGLEKQGHLVVYESVALGGLPSDLRTITFGAGRDCRVRLLGEDGGRAEFRLDGRALSARVPGGGLHRARLIGAVLGVLSALERDLEPALDLPESLIPAGRGNVTVAGGVTLVDDSYNANPESMKAALEQLGGESGRKVAILGEMLELGEEGPSYHAGLASWCERLDRVVAVGDGTTPLFERLQTRQQWLWCSRADDALLEALVGELRAGDRVLVKGSNRVFWVNGFVTRLCDALEERNRW
ncbi:MAG: UDP-N-acetylmuramoyl-tripeptide--D-alanyl-D-alanine ligase [Gammaproteobacteria bacterium]|nr:UDP-N-acetylmuramoyl-tripeptide--D-alanyl-D-alanine ligase [Gammaproteobacteria bacterium]